MKIAIVLISPLMALACGGPEKDSSGGGVGSLDQRALELLREEGVKGNEEHPPSTSLEEEALYRDCLGTKLLERIEELSPDQTLSREDMDRIWQCIVDLGLEDELIMTVDPDDVPELVAIHNEETLEQIECLTSRGWNVVETAPGPDGKVFWEPQEDVFDGTGHLREDFEHDANECSS